MKGRGIMEWWKALFDGKESLTLSEFEEGIAGKKLVDLTDGGYVAKEKFDAETKKLSTALTTATKELDDLKATTKGDDGLEAQLAKMQETIEALNAKNTAAEARIARADHEKAVAEKVKDPKLARLALYEAERLISDEMDFDAAFAKVLADDPDYTAEPAPVTVKTGDAPKAPLEAGDPYKAAIDAALPDRSPTK